jgi:hypothetical protein
METMRTNLVSNVLRTSAFALACLALAGADVKASALHTYSTTGAILGDGISTSAATSVANSDVAASTGISASGVTGTSAVSYNPVASGSFLAPSSVGLGEFVVSTLPTGQSTTYTNTHFSIIYNPLTIGGVPYPAGSPPVTITGELNGTITGNQSTVVATFDPIKSPVFTADGNFLNTLSVTNSPLSLVPASAGGRTTVQAQVSTSGPVPAPEPTTMAILATSLVGFGLRKKLRSGRKSS